MTESFDDHLARLDEAIRLAGAHQSNPEVDDETFLARHESIRDLLEPLLEDDDDTDDREIAAHSDTTAGSEPPAGTDLRHLADYRILREIGRGGMGVVYLAEHAALGREVALKVLPAHLTLSAVQIERFRREAAAAAKLRHPGIIPIYNVGEDAGTHYIAMEFVDGGTLADQTKRLREPRKIAAVAAAVAEALQHAHEHGIAHRDIKPQNILINPDGAPLVADFGLAKDFDRASLTATGGFAGTPHYMSPEQVSPRYGTLDFRTDVFSLGVVIYEMLAGACPFDGDSSQEVLANVIQRDPRPLVTRNRKVPNDLATICHKALEKSPTDRYGSAGEMAADLRRFLAGEAIHATPPTWRTRVSKFIRRRKLATTAVVLAAMIAVGIPWAYTAYANQQRENFQQAVTAVRRVVQLLTDTKLARQPGQDAVYLRQLRGASRDYQNLLAQRPTDPQLRFQMFSVIGKLARAYGLAREDERAESAFAKGLDLAQQLVSEYPGNDLYRAELAGMLFNRSFLLPHRRSAEDIFADYRRARNLYLEVVASDGAKFADHARREAANVSCGLGIRLLALYKTAEAKAELDRALELWNSQSEAARTLPLSRERLGVIRHRRGAFFYSSGNPQAAIKEHEIALGIATELLEAAAADRSHRELQANTTAGLGNCYHDLSNLEKAEEMLSLAIGYLESMVRDFSSVHTYSRTLLSTRNALALTLSRQKRHAEAIPVLDRLLADIEPLLAKQPDDESLLALRALAINSRAFSGWRRKESDQLTIQRFEKSISLLKELTEREEATPNTFSQLGSVIHGYAQFLFQTDLEAALRQLQRAVEAQLRAHRAQPENVRFRTYLRNHYSLSARTTLALKDHAGAFSYSKKAFELGQKIPLVLTFCAAIVGRSISLLKTDGTLSTEQVRNLEAAYGKFAVDCLRRSYRAGDPRAATFHESRSLAVFRQREDFQALIAEIRKK